MITIEEKVSGRVEVTISREFSRADINRLKAVLRKNACDSVKPRLLLIVKNFRGWYGAGPWWSDLTLSDECNCGLSFQRIALTGLPSWKVWMRTFVSSLPANEIQFFAGEDISRARS